MKKFKAHDKVMITDELELFDYNRRKTGVVVAVDGPEGADSDIVIKLNNGGLKRFKESQLAKISG